MKYNCYQCEKPCEKFMRNMGLKNGRPWKHKFCGMECYNRWRKDQHLAVKRKWLIFQREVWGTIPFERFKPSGARGYAKKYEKMAEKLYLPKEGFTNIVNFTEMSNQFFVDYVASKLGRRVLVDATVKLKAYVPKKMRMAEALGMDLYVIHVSPLKEGLYHLNKMKPGTSVSRVPAKVIRKLS